MRRLLITAALLAASLGQTACAGGMSAEQSEALTRQVLGNLAGCTRTYTAAVGGLSPSASLHIECNPVPAARPADPAPVVWGEATLGEPRP